MFDGVLQIGTFVFDIDDLPERIPLGGDQMLAVRMFPGGKKDVQSFGTQEQNPAWDGVFNYTALDKVRALDAMWRTGQVVPITIGTLDPRYGIIKTFKWSYMNDYKIEYQIEIELAPQSSPLVPSQTASAGVATPDSASDAPQKTYTVKQGDTLWDIACAHYSGDGTQYRKIADANNIANPDVISAGQKLVIPA